MAGAALAHPIAAGRAVGDLGGDGLENRLHVRPRGRRAAGHDARAAARAFLAAGNAGADVKQPLALDVFRAADGVLEQRVAAVNDDVARLRGSGKRCSMNSSTALPALTSIITRRGFLSLATISSSECAPSTFVPFASLLRKSSTFETVRLIGHDGEAVVVHVEDEILAHDGQTDEGNVSLWFHIICWLIRKTVRKYDGKLRAGKQSFAPPAAQGFFAIDPCRPKPR